ncbi:hypothetical protein [Winogradskyella psychrotolerans]|uniref:hypothetical protein n=1 Tax=Winogradskyella psychrotolerans TaxID=1344585 RepID=UPI001C074439|nr:hypothetical protein [Winogradskyella psychrotolerans]MBU2926917.1 hypothetical protein [Winogradskyella psychrotolerans]
MKNLIIILIFGIGFNNVNAQSTELKKGLVKKVDTISFKSNGFNNYREIILLNNDEFIKIDNYVSDYGGKSTFKKYYGKFNLTDSILTLKPKEIELKTYTGNPERKTLKEKIDYKSDSEFKITTVFVLKTHNDIQYLIPKEYALDNLQFEKISRRTLVFLFKRPLSN